MSEKSEDQNDDTTAESKKTPPPKPTHDCIICSPKENCKHSVPLHKTIVPLVRGKAGVEDLFLKINEVVDWLSEKGLILGTKNKSKN